MRFRIALAAGLLLLACGYHRMDRQRGLPSDIDRIQISPLENRSNVPGLEEMISDALVEEFSRRGQIEPVYSATAGDEALRLGGVIEQAQIRPSALSPVGLALELEIKITVDLDLVRTADGTPIWEDYEILLTERFLGSADPGVHDSNRIEALRRMSAELAGRVADALVQTF
jgi:hypothetical protein